jgi:hypothetical protein
MNMNIPGFTAEASLNRPTEFYRMAPIGGQVQWGRVLPQLIQLDPLLAGELPALTRRLDEMPGQSAGAPRLIHLHFEGGDPVNICKYRTLDITIDTDSGAVTSKTTVVNICAHP